MKWIVIVLVMVGVFVPTVEVFAGSNVDDHLKRRGGETGIKVLGDIIREKVIERPTDREEHEQQKERKDQDADIRQRDELRRNEIKQQQKEQDALIKAERERQKAINKALEDERDAEIQAARDLRKAEIEADKDVRRARVKAGAYDPYKDSDVARRARAKDAVEWHGGDPNNLTEVERLRREAEAEELRQRIARLRGEGVPQTSVPRASTSRSTTPTPEVTSTSKPKRRVVGETDNYYILERD